LALLELVSFEKLVAADDATLLRLARDGRDRRDEVFRVLYDRYKDELLGFLARFLGSDALAEDVHQEAFFRVYRSLDRCDPESSFRAFVYQVARNAGIDAVRARAKDARLARARAELARGEAAPDFVRELESREALDRLPEDARALLIQRHAVGMSLAELAASWSVHERTIRARLRAAAGLLARSLHIPTEGRP
jgi:RNA polymerase sigma-70 factor (ECF subfamily)